MSSFTHESDSYYHVNRNKTCIKLRMELARFYAKYNELDSEFALLIDYHKHSGTKRAYLVNLLKLRIIDSFMVSHGCGDNPWGRDESRISPQFSNRFDSHCSSLGRFKIGKRGYSSWGNKVKYTLHGLDTTNSNAKKRVVVLHGWENVPDEEVYPAGTPEGWGCPAVSVKTMNYLDSCFRNKPKPVLLWTY